MLVIKNRIIALRVPVRGKEEGRREGRREREREGKAPRRGSVLFLSPRPPPGLVYCYNSSHSSRASTLTTHTCIYLCQHLCIYVTFRLPPLHGLASTPTLTPVPT